METTTLYIKNMVCNRCIKVVKAILEEAGLEVINLKLGEAVIRPSNSDLSKTAARLKEEGFELLNDRKSKYIEKIKNTVIDLIHQQDNFDLHINFSSYISDKVAQDYNYLSTLFSSTEGITIEKYIILQRIEKAKELIIYNELNLSEIAFKLGYSSLQHLSNQFKKVTGMTPSQFKKQHENSRKALDELI